MLRATIDDLRLATGGELRLGELPPLHGERTLLSSVAHYLSELVPGQVYWPLNADTADESRLAEEAFALGAIGVVHAGRRVVPWAGCWSVQVKDAWQAWLEWQVWADRQGLVWDDQDWLAEPSPPRIANSLRWQQGSWRNQPESQQPNESQQLNTDDSARAAVIRIHQFVEARHKELD